MIALSSGAFALALLPERGGAVASFTFDGREVLRPARRDASGALETACFPLVPYANRIAGGAFRFGGRAVSLRRNFGDHPHPLHGHGWQAAWRATATTSSSATLAFDHEPDDWPWAYSSEQRFALTPAGLEISLRLTNHDDSAMPFSLGFHPYFPRLDGTLFTADVEGVWLASEAGIPTERAESKRFLDLASGAPLAFAPAVDHCHYGWRGEARIDQPSLDMSVRFSASSDLDFLHVYVPAGENFFCAEPVSAMPNAFNWPEPARLTGLRALAPADSAIVWMRINAC